MVFSIRNIALAFVSAALLQGCSQADVPDARNVDVPNPTFAESRPDAVNDRPDSVMYLPLGRDILMPEMDVGDSLPSSHVGPFELRSETLAGALQLILADYDISLAFESEEGLNKRVTIANLQGPLNKVVERVCGLANLYCAYDGGLITVKDTQTFTVKIPPISQDTSFMSNIASGLQAIIGTQPIVDESTRTIVYEATHRNAEMARRYFQRMRSSTALIVFETYIWEVTLSGGNSTGIRWDYFEQFGKYKMNLDLSGTVGADFANPVSIGLPTIGADGEAFNPTDIFDFLSRFGAVKTISQPQITVLSGSSARLRAADTQTYVAQVAETIDNGQSTTSVNTDTVDTGFTIEIDSAWDNATVYANISIDISDVSDITDFNFTSGGGGTTTVQLPDTTEREVETQVRIRPGDSLLIAGLVREIDNYDSTGPGFMKPILSTSRTATTSNLELVFLLRPRVVVYTSPTEADYYGAGQHSGGKGHVETNKFNYDFAPFGDLDIDTTSPSGKNFKVLERPQHTQSAVRRDGVVHGTVSAETLDPSVEVYRP